MYLNAARFKQICACLWLCIITNVCFSLPEDRSQIMYLQADSADLNQQTHRGVYIGNVVFSQGETNLRAAKAITEGNIKNQLVKAIIYGDDKTQAHYWTLTAPDKPAFHAYADTIYYYPNNHIIELIGHAKVEQGNDSFSAPLIRYDTLNHHVVSKHDGTARTTIIIHPGKRHE